MYIDMDTHFERMNRWGQPTQGSGVRRNHTSVTPHKISVILFIEKYAKLKPKYWESQPSDSNTSLPTVSTRERKATCLMTVRLVQGGDVSLGELLQMIESSQLQQQHISNFMTALHQMYLSGIDQLLNLFDAVERFSNQDQKRSESFPCLWTSVVGLYMRRLNLSFRKLSFCQVTSLYQRFRLYYEECYNTHPGQLPDTAQMVCEESSLAEDGESDAQMEDMMEDTATHDPTSDLTMCSSEVMAINDLPPKNILAIPNLQQRGGIGARAVMSHSSRQQAELFLSQQTTLLQFNEAAAISPAELQEKIRQMVQQNPDLAEAHYLSYLNCLRVKEFSGAVHSLLRTYDGHLPTQSNSNNTPTEEHSKSIRYAALNLAALHAQFGHRKAGLTALQEAIRLAQESSDAVCLQHCLAWLYTLSPAHKILLSSRSLAKSCELSLSYLSSLGRLNHVTQLAQTQAQPAQLLESVTRAEAINCQHSLVALQHGAWALRAALWATWGDSTMTSLASQLLLHLNTHHPTHQNIYYASQPTASAICNIATALANLIYYQVDEELLLQASLSIPPYVRHGHIWHFHTRYFKRAILDCYGRPLAAKTIINDNVFIHLYQDRMLYKLCEVLLGRGELTKMWKELGELRNDSEIVGELRVRLLLLESQCVVAGSNGAAVALPILVEALTTAQQHHLTYLHALTHLNLANVQLQLGLVAEARCSVGAGFGTILAGGSVYDQARARLVRIKLQVTQAKGKERTGELLKCAQALEQVAKLFMKVQAYHKVRETHYLKARLYHEVGYIEERNKCALEFRVFEQQHPCQSHQPSINSF
ncbi:unnamed protein product, partial [Meganyctiphanes norvegica]